MSKQSNLELRKEWNDGFTFVTLVQTQSTYPH